MYIYISGLCLASQWATWLTRMEKKLSHTLCCGSRNPIWLTAVWTTHKDNGSVPFHSWFKLLLYIFFYTDGSMLSCCLHQILTVRSNWTHHSWPRQCCFSVLLFNFGESIVRLKWVAAVWSSAAVVVDLLQDSTCWASEKLFCIAWFYQVIIWVTVVFLSAQSNLAILLWLLILGKMFLTR